MKETGAMRMQLINKTFLCPDGLGMTLEVKSHTI